MTTTTPAYQMFTSDERNAVRKAWRTGKRRVKIGKTLYELSKQTRTEHYVLNRETGKNVKVKGEQYILARAVGQQVPVMSVSVK
jgi:hypothetical protein